LLTLITAHILEVQTLESSVHIQASISGQVCYVVRKTGAFQRAYTTTQGTLPKRLTNKFHETQPLLRYVN